MKILLISLLLASSAQASFHAPKSWVNSNEEVTEENFKKSDIGFGSYVDRILDAQLKALETLPANEEKGIFSGWKLDGYKTDLSISKSGLFGVGALKAKKAVELNWARKSNKEAKSESSSIKNIELNDEMTLEEMKAQMEPIITWAVSSKKVNNESRFRKNLHERVEKVFPLMKVLPALEKQGWRASKFRLEASFGVSGELLNIVDLGADARVRLEWKRTSTSNKLAELNKSELKLVKFLSNLAEDLEAGYQKSEIASQSYKFEKFSLGLGTSHKGFWGIGKSKGGVSGLLFLKRVTKKNLPISKVDGDIDFVSNNEDKFLGKIFKVKRKRFRKGITKAFSITDWFSQKSEKKNSSKWHVNKIKTAFEISYKGIFGLSTTTGKTKAEIYFKK